jgi:hypothetical protein
VDPDTREDDMPRLGCTPSPPMPWGSHVCSYYQSTSQLQQLVISFLQVGLEDHEGCVWILPPWHTPTTAATALQWAIPNVYDYLATAQLELMPSDEWYGWPGAINLDRIVAEGRQKIARLSARFGGLRVAGDTSWVQSAEQRAQLVAYEGVVDEMVQAANVLALCTYPATTWTPPDMLNVFRTHQSVLLPAPLGWSRVDLRCL